jgi:hypothetical protein
MSEAKMLMQNLRSLFELQIFRDGRWIISSVYDDRDIAMTDAWRLDRSGRKVRLREDSGSGSGSRTVFVSTKVKDTWKVEQQRIAARARAHALHPQQPAEELPAKEPELDMSFHPYRLLALFTLIVFFGLAAIFGLHSLYASI